MCAVTPGLTVSTSVSSTCAVTERLDASVIVNSAPPEEIGLPTLITEPPELDPAEPEPPTVTDPSAAAPDQAEPPEPEAAPASSWLSEPSQAVPALAWPLPRVTTPEMGAEMRSASTVRCA